MTHHHHAHDHPHAPQIQSSPSLLRLSAAERLAGVGLMVAVLWAAIFWAIR